MLNDLLMIGSGFALIGVANIMLNYRQPYDFATVACYIIGIGLAVSGFVMLALELL